MTMTMPTNRSLGLRVKFIVAFSRFEYALKEAGYAVAGRNNAASPGWSCFKTIVRNTAVLDNCREVATILNNPPKKQIYEDHELSWKIVELGDGGNSYEVLEAIKRLRNNLFHGGKGNEAAHEQERSDDLLQSGLLVLEKALETDDKVKHAFWDCFDTEFEKNIFTVDGLDPN